MIIALAYACVVTVAGAVVAIACAIITLTGAVVAITRAVVALACAVVAVARAVARRVLGCAYDRVPCVGVDHCTHRDAYVRINRDVARCHLVYV